MCPIDFFTKVQKQFSGGKIANKWCWNNWIFMDKTSERTNKRQQWPKPLKLNPMPYTKINPKRIMDLKCKTIKLVENIIGKNLGGLELEKEFLDLRTKAWILSEDSWPPTPFFSEEKMVDQNSANATGVWRDPFQWYMWDPFHPGWLHFKNRLQEWRDQSLPRRELDFPSYLTSKMLKLFRNSFLKKYSLVESY